MLGLATSGQESPPPLSPHGHSAITAYLMRIKCADLQSAMLANWAGLFRGAAPCFFAGPLSEWDVALGGASLNKKSRLMVSQEGRTWRPVVHPLTWEVIRLNEDGSISHHSYASTEAAAKEMVEIMDEAVHEGRE